MIIYRHVVNVKYINPFNHIYHVYMLLEQMITSGRGKLKRKNKIK
jgi:hypothetical protein